jgi:predicted RNA binding protein YcfA (HicA-like mRNA interferase family)
MADQPSRKRLRRLYEAVVRARTNARIDDVARLLFALGFEVKGSKRGKGSHHAFRKPGHKPITIPEKRPLNISYVDEALEIAEKELELLFGPTWRSDRDD